MQKQFLDWLVAPGCGIKQTFRIRTKLRLNRQLGIIGVPSRSAQHLQATISTDERVQKDHLQEIERVAHSTQRDLTADYASYVLVPMVLLVVLMALFRRFLPS